jgi:hypothetical protein
MIACRNRHRRRGFARRNAGETRAFRMLLHDAIERACNERDWIDGTDTRPDDCQEIVLKIAG